MWRLKETYLTSDKKEYCCGCTACQNVCGQHAIEMQADEQGFLYPKINKEKCVDCGMCQKVCRFSSRVPENKYPTVYAVKHKRTEVRMTSSSGGVFSSIAQYVLDKGGVVYGAAFDERFNVVHVRDEKGYERFKTSKYVQSDLKEVFCEIKEDLKQGRMVLFTGTGCQADGLYAYIPKHLQERLVVCDIVCHGVPSPKIWREYLDFLERKNRTKISHVNFRDKSKSGWHNSAVTIKGENKEILSEGQTENIYFEMFFTHMILRPSCFNCKYTNTDRAGDITIGDFWGIEDFHTEYDDDKGTSLVMVNSDKGKEIIEKIKKELEMLNSSTMEAANRKQPNLSNPAENWGLDTKFWNCYSRSGFEFSLKMCTHYGDKYIGIRILRMLVYCADKVKDIFHRIIR